ncbi:ornithine cyclodeaminase [Wenxinia saemankumensis]|uniref:Ornithine cyclodeaminase n=1 Tax=Wenxinia saemankumensis TaxID=1447782 RepID=A0A1M6A1M6_9RHOB|nr:ornithine cyclodeaminase [Wenxinia saemankumensis]SHI30346.1 ornithine cyclodeaminase [Wenxinia saemankumensis]
MTTIPGPKALVPFVSVDHMMQLVHRIGIRQMFRGIAAEIERDFQRWEKFDKTARIPAHHEHGVIELMPTADGEIYGFKYVNGHPRNARDGLQTVTAFGVLSDLATGYPILLSEMTILTALRTAAMSALTASYLAPKGSKVMAMIGNGAQSEFQSLAMQEIVGIDTVRLWDADPRATEKAARNLAGQGLTIVSCATAEEAIQGAQIITTATADKRNNTILTDNMVGQGVHLNAVGGDSPGKTELARGIVEKSTIFVEFPPQSRIEGEVQQMPPDHPVTELWQVMSGTAPGRISAEQVTLFDSVGFAVEDFAALRFVRGKALETGLHADLDMIADPDDPRDLYGMLMRAAP